jgi:hypothetical protein
MNPGDVLQEQERDAALAAQTRRNARALERRLDE